MTKKYEGFYKAGFQTSSHKLKVIQKMKNMINQNQKVTGKQDSISLPE